MPKKIYFDHGATAPLCQEAKQAMEPFLSLEYGNASTDYALGKRARAAMETARGQIAACIGADSEEIYFTSGGSESDNWAIKGIAGVEKQKGKHLITDVIEHHAVLHSCQYLQRLGYELTYLGVDVEGLISLQELRNSIRPDTTLISIMYANNEIGTLEPIDQIGRLAHEKQVLFHTDGVQAVGHVPMNLHRMPVDMLSASGHKFGGPKGIGFLYVQKGVPIPSYIHGGAQEKGKRAGTENVASIVGMAVALQRATRGLEIEYQRQLQLREYFIERVQRELAGVRVNGSRERRLPGNISLSFRNVEAEPLLILLEEEGICASAGSACNTGQSRISHVIKGIQVPSDYAPGTVRFTLGEQNTREQVDQVVKALIQYVPLLRVE